MDKVKRTAMMMVLAVLVLTSTGFASKKSPSTPRADETTTHPAAFVLRAHGQPLRPTARLPPDSSCCPVDELPPTGLAPVWVPQPLHRSAGDTGDRRGEGHQHPESLPGVHRCTSRLDQAALADAPVGRM